MRFYCRLLILSVVVLLNGLLVYGQSMPEVKAGWKLSIQTYSFRLFSFAEALRKIDSCGVRYVEAFPRQAIGGGFEGTMDYHMPTATQQAIKKMLKDRGPTLIAYGVIIPETEQEWVKLFEFAKTMGIQNIYSELAPE